jgi:hypothetical protein
VECRQNNISEQTFYRWRDKNGGMEVADARRNRFTSAFRSLSKVASIVERCRRQFQNCQVPIFFSGLCG